MSKPFVLLLLFFASCQPSSAPIAKPSAKGKYEQILQKMDSLYLPNQRGLSAYMQTYLEHFQGAAYDTALATAFWHLSQPIENEQFSYTAENLYGKKNYWDTSFNVRNLQALLAQGMRVSEIMEDYEAPEMPLCFEPMIPDLQRFTLRNAQPDNFFYQIAYRQTPNYDAVVYKMQPRWGDDQPLPHNYYLLTYTKDGKKISTLNLAHRNSAYFQTATLQGNHIETQQYKVEELEETPAAFLIKKSTKIGVSKHYYLNEKGEIEGGGAL